jgi:hypothetical protein
MICFSEKLHLDIMVFLGIGITRDFDCKLLGAKGFVWIQYSFERGVSVLNDLGATRWMIGATYVTVVDLSIFCSHAFSIQTQRSFITSLLQLQIFAQRTSKLPKLLQAYPNANCQ